jgi:hypothetical protein
MDFPYASRRTAASRREYGMKVKVLGGGQDFTSGFLGNSPTHFRGLEVINQQFPDLPELSSAA